MFFGFNVKLLSYFHDVGDNRRHCGAPW